jgi:hypothetical protein
MPKQTGAGENPTVRASTAAIGLLTEAFTRDPGSFSREAELHTRLSSSLIDNPTPTVPTTAAGSVSLVHQEYPTPFKCHMGDLRFEVLDDDARARRGHYDLVVLNPWWVDQASSKALRNDDFALFRKEIRDKAQPDDPPLCLIGVEIHLVRTRRPRLADYSRIGQDLRKLLLSGTLANGWRFMDHRYMLVYSHHSQPHEAKWRELVQSAWEADVDPRNVRLAWTSPQGTRWSG